MSYPYALTYPLTGVYPYYTPYSPCVNPCATYYYTPVSPLYYQPYYLCYCPAMILPQEAWVDASSPVKEVFIGGSSDVSLSLEYMPASGAASPRVTTTITAPDGSTSTWQEDPIPAGYHVKSDFSPVAPGSRIELQVTDAMARLRWCEFVSCQNSAMEE
jgi:hypothetical protein